MEGEMYNYAQVWLTVFLSLCYCHFVVAEKTQKGLTRLFCVLPVVCLFLALPLKLRSVHLGGTTAFFFAWLANFKLLLFAFGKGPLCSHPSISLPSFAALACLPIKVLQHNNEDPSPKSKLFEDSSLKSHQNGHNNEDPSPKSKIFEDPSLKSHQNGKIKGHNSVLNYAIKVVLLGILVRVNDYSEQIHPRIILVLYCFHIYFALEIMLAVVAAMARTLLKLELEPQFNEPYLSTSLQDFWGRRWNLMVTSILRPAVYEPIRDLSSRVVGRKLASLPAVMAAFVVSAVMHELIFYYLGRVRPTWEITWFFLLHGACLVAEIALKKLIAGKFRLPGLVSGALTIGFVMVTGFWLFFPQLLRCQADVRAFEEYAAAGALLQGIKVAVADTIRGLTNSNLVH